MRTILKITKLRGTPVFTVHASDPRFAKVYGATRLDKNSPLWYYPAFYPVYRYVLNDFKVLQIPLELSDAAKKVVAQLDQYTERIEKRILPPGFKFKTKPYAHQLEGLVHVLYNFRAALFYACGLGKGLPPSTRILTPTGWCTINDLQVGSTVIGGNGQPCTVTGVFPQPVQALNRITFTDGVSIVCDSAHLWKVQDISAQTRGGAWAIKSAADLYNVRLQYGTSGHRNKFRIPMVAPVCFTAQELPLDPYLVGVLLGDVYWGQRATPSFTNPDDEIGARVRTVLPAGVHLRRTVYARNCPIWHISTRKGKREVNPVTAALTELGLMGARSWEKHVPDVYLYNTYERRLALLQGLMDTNDYAGTTPEFSSASKTLAEAVVFLVQTFGGTARMRSKQPWYIHKGKRKRGRLAWRVTFTLPPGIVPFSLPRKVEKYRTVTRGLNRRIQCIEPAGRGATICITVDSPDNCFVTEHCLVTHNTKIVIDWQRAINAKLLVLCPRVVLKVWPHEAMRHGFEQEFAIIDAKSRKQKLTQIEDARNYPGVVISYDSARRYYEELTRLPYNAIVADESHLLKGHNSVRTKGALELSKKASRRIIMSGTPSTGDPRDMWSQFRFLSPCFLPEQFWKFKNTYCRTSPHNKHIVIGYKNLDVLNRRVNVVALRKTKEQCVDLPPRQIVDIRIDLEAQQRKVYNTLIYTEEYDVIRTAMSEDIFTAQGLIDIPNAAILVNKLLQVTCGFVYLKPDAPPICDRCEYLRDCINEDIKPYTKNCKTDSTPRPPIVERMKTNAKLTTLLHKLDEILIEPTHKCIVWCQFKAEMDCIQEAVQAHWQKTKQKHILVRVDGKTGKPERLVDHFNTDPKCRVYLGQVETGVGVTLNAANYVVYFSLPWKLLAYDQSLDRNHRVGQERHLTVFRLIARNTIDVHVARSLVLKRTVSETIIATLQCTQCQQQKQCEERGVSLFESECKFKRQIARTTARARSIK